MRFSIASTELPRDLRPERERGTKQQPSILPGWGCLGVAYFLSVSGVKSCCPTLYNYLIPTLFERKNGTHGRAGNRSINPLHTHTTTCRKYFVIAFIAFPTACERILRNVEHVNHCRLWSSTVLVSLANSLSSLARTPTLQT